MQLRISPVTGWCGYVYRCLLDGMVLQVLSRLTSPLSCVALTSRRGPGRRDVYVTTQLHLGEIPLLSRRPSPAASDLDEQPHQRGGTTGTLDHGHGQHLMPQKLPLHRQQPYLVYDAPDDCATSKDLAATASACSWLSIYDDQQSPVDPAADVDDKDDDDGTH